MAVILKQLNAYRQTRPVYEATVKNLNALKTDGKKLPSRFDRYKFAKTGRNKTIKNMYKLDTKCYNGVKL